MLSKLRLAFTSSSSTPPNTAVSDSANGGSDGIATATTTSGNSVSKRGRSSTIPSPASTAPPKVGIAVGSSSTSLRVPMPYSPAQQQLALALDRPIASSSSSSSANSPLSSSPARSVRSMTVVVSASPSASSALPSCSRLEGTSSSNASITNTTGPSSVFPTISPSLPPSPPSANYTPLATSLSLNFPNAPFSTPATPPRAALSSSSSTPQARQSPHYLNNDNAASYRSQSTSNNPLHELELPNNLPVPNVNPMNQRKKTKSTATLPAWIISSFSSSPSSPSSTSSPKEGSSSRDVISDRRPTAESTRKPLTESTRDSTHPTTKVPPVAATAFPLRLDTSRRGSLPIASLAPESAASRPRSPSMQMHIQTLQIQHAQLNSQRAASGHTSSSSTPPSPHTPVRLDRSPLNAPSPLSTSSSPYQIIDSGQSSPSMEMHNSTASPARPGRRKSILGKRRNFTEVWNGSGSTSSKANSNVNQTSTVSSENTADKMNTDTNKKKNSGKWNHRKIRDNLASKQGQPSSSTSGDYSSLLTTSKKIFSKSVDDLSSFTRNSFLSSSSMSPINYSRPRKSVDERRITGGFNSAGGSGVAGNAMYSVLSSVNGPKSAGSPYVAFAGAVGRGVGEHADDEEELEGLSSGSSASLAHSPIPSENSTSSMHSLASLQMNDKASMKDSHSHNQHHIYKVPKLPSLPTSQSKNSKEKKGEKSHRKAISSAQVQLPPSISLPGGLCIESTASILASSMDATEPEVALSYKKAQPSIDSNKRKSMDSRSVRSENILGTSPGLAPAFDISPTMPKSAPPVPTSGSNSQLVTSSFPMRPPLASRKSSGNASVRSTKSISNSARVPSFGSPKASPATLPPSPQIHVTADRPKVTRQRSSQIILMEGLLQRKTDCRSHLKASSTWTFPFSSSVASSATSMFTSTFSSSSSCSSTYNTNSKVQESPRQRPVLGTRRTSEANVREIDLTKGWKPFYAMLRGTNLYLYKLPNDMNWQAKACFSNYTGSKAPSASLSSSSSSNRLLTNYTASTPLQSTNAINENKLKASISTQSKATYLLPIANSSLRVTLSASKGDVFELLTEEGEVAVLQAATREEADKWRDTLSKTGVSIANKRASYLEAIENLDLGDRVEQQSSSSNTVHGESTQAEASSVFKGTGKVFGVPLEQLIVREKGKIPAVADFLFKEVERKGLFETGIYRVPGENRVMQEMKAKLDAGQFLDFRINPSFSDPHNLASLTKLWLRELPEVISPAFYSSFIDANGVEGYEERLCAIRDLIWQLPAPSFHLLDRLCEHLHLVAEHELENQMHAPNLAIVFAPTILRPPDGSDSYALLMSNLGKAAKLVSSLIVQHHWIFSGQEVEEEASADAGPEENSKGPENITVKSADMLAASTHQAMNNSKSPHIKNEPSHTEQTVSFTE